MRKYGKTVRENGGYSIVEVYDVRVDGTRFLGYAILSDEDEVGFFTDLGDAVNELDRLIGDMSPESPSVDMW